MGEPGPLKQQLDEPDVFFLPLSVPELDAFDDLDAGVLSRRLPHFLHLLLNEGDQAPTGLLEVQSPPDEGPVHWVTLEEPIDPDEALQLLPDADTVRALVTGVLGREGDALSVTLWVHRNGEDTQCVEGRLSTGAPMAGLRRLTVRLARALELTPFWPEAGLLTERGDAFMAFLQGLDGAALLNGHLDIDEVLDPRLSLAPFAGALELDHGFGLALRTAHISMANALESGRMTTAASVATLDACFASLPADGDGCVAVAEHLAVLGDEDRARAWLEHATSLSPVPVRALESLGILLANQGDTARAQELWRRGLELDGHPDFLAHLARLAFSEGATHDGWDRALRGLRRMCERAIRPGEWDDDGRGAGLLLRYLVEHLDDEKPPEELGDLLLDLVDALQTPSDRIELGRCLLAVGATDAARSELLAGLAQTDDPRLRDVVARALLAIDIPDFDRRFAAAVDVAAHGDDPGLAVEELAAMLDYQASFWPALFFMGVAERRRGNTDRALDLMADVLALRPGQPDALGEMADLFAARGNPKRALECIDDALAADGEDAQMLGSRARYLAALGRRRDAREAVDRALAVDPDQAELLELKRRLG